MAACNNYLIITETSEWSVSNSKIVLNYYVNYQASRGILNILLWATKSADNTFNSQMTKSLT